MANLIGAKEFVPLLNSSLSINKTHVPSVLFSMAIRLSGSVVSPFDATVSIRHRPAYSSLAFC